jgi:hypothetical protein
MNPHFLPQDQASRLAHRLGYASLIPSVLLSLACWGADPAWLGVFIKGQLAYGVLMLALVGGVHWGAAMMAKNLSEQDTKRALRWSLAPALTGWFATMVGGFGFAVLIIAFVAAYQVDKRLFLAYAAPEWIVRLRFNLTCVMVAALVLTVVAANVRG